LRKFCGPEPPKTATPTPVMLEMPVRHCASRLGTFGLIVMNAYARSWLMPTCVAAIVGGV
jgi:hypothetical protein